MLKFISDRYESKKIRTEAGKLLALRISFLLENFAIDNAGIISDQVLFDQTDGGEGSEATLFPISPELPSSEAYKYLSPGLLNKVYSIAQIRQLMARDVRGVLIFSPEDFATEMVKQIAKMSLRCVDVANELREEFDLPPRDFVHDRWNILKFLHEHTTYGENLR